MSLQYVIDGYNVIKHPLLTRTNNKDKDSRLSFLEFIRRNKLTGSLKNKVIVVFDGYPDSRERDNRASIDVIYSRKISADEKIRKIIQGYSGQKNIIVVSDDKEIQFSVRPYGVRVMGVEEFINKKEKSRYREDNSLKPELTHTLMHQINQELRQIWLKE
ncbi:MAG: NYN domain-containing protein [Candidatus Omnitrophica bacterium]|nr:NYN domain-containing protein [Candidatus Omnitrophota bacterium]